MQGDSTPVFIGGNVIATIAKKHTKKLSTSAVINPFAAMMSLENERASMHLSAGHFYSEGVNTYIKKKRAKLGVTRSAELRGIIQKFVCS